MEIYLKNPKASENVEKIIDQLSKIESKTLEAGKNKTNQEKIKVPKIATEETERNDDIENTKLSQIIKNCGESSFELSDSLFALCSFLKNHSQFFKAQEWHPIDKKLSFLQKVRDSLQQTEKLTRLTRNFQQKSELCEKSKIFIEFCFEQITLTLKILVKETAALVLTDFSVSIKEAQDHLKNEHFSGRLKNSQIWSTNCVDRFKILRNENFEIMSVFWDMLKNEIRSALISKIGQIVQIKALFSQLKKIWAEFVTANLPSSQIPEFLEIIS